MSFAAYFWAFVFVTAGINHFIHPEFYIKIMPHWFPAKGFLNAGSGVLEIVLGLMLLVRALNPVARMGLVVLLILFMAVHIWHLYRLPKPELWYLFWARALGQFVIIYAVWRAGERRVTV